MCIKKKHTKDGIFRNRLKHKKKKIQQLNKKKIRYYRKIRPVVGGQN